MYYAQSEYWVFAYDNFVGIKKRRFRAPLPSEIFVTEEALTHGVFLFGAVRETFGAGQFFSIVFSCFFAMRFGGKTAP